jgi:hypothetical protein
MSLASELIQDALDASGRGGEVITTDGSQSAKGLKYLKHLLAYLKGREIILEEVVSGSTATIIDSADLTSLNDELNEPSGSYVHLVNYLATYLLAPTRAGAEDAQFIPTAKFSYESLADLYYKPTIPNKRTSRLLPRGQGSDRRYTGFFQGQTLADDYTE